MQIPVIFATDINYIFYTTVAITSLAQNASKDTVYRVYILTGEDLKDGYPLMKEVEKRFSNLEIRWVLVSETMFKDVFIYNKHISKAAFYRLGVCDWIAEDKCIYLDSDVVVTEDLQELYQIDLQENIIAGVRDYWVDLTNEMALEQRRLRAGLLSMDQYVNSGVLLLNFKKMREEHMVELFKEHMKRDYQFEDQDILNVSCYNRILRLQPKWNIFTRLLGRLDEFERHGISAAEVNQMRRHSGIIHYATPFIRPWETSIFLCNDIWWNYAEEWKNTEEYQRVRAYADKNDIGYLWEPLVQCCRQQAHVVLFGFTQLARTVYDRLAEEGMREKVTFCDNNADKQRQEYDGKKVHSFEETKCLKGALYVVMSQQRRKEVVAFLRQNGIEEQQILWYIKKDLMFYKCLRPELCEEGGAGNV